MSAPARNVATVSGLRPNGSSRLLKMSVPGPLRYFGDGRSVSLSVWVGEIRPMNAAMSPPGVVMGRTARSRNRSTTSPRREVAQTGGE